MISWAAAPLLNSSPMPQMIIGMNFFFMGLIALIANNSLWSWQAQAGEHRWIGRVHGNGQRVDVAAAGQIKPLAGAQAVGLGLENPTQMIGRPRNGERVAADAGRNVRRIIGGVRVLHDGLDLVRERLHIFQTNRCVHQIGEGGKINVQIRGRIAATGNMELQGGRWRPKSQRSQITQLVKSLCGIEYANQILSIRYYLSQFKTQGAARSKKVRLIAGEQPVRVK